MRSFELDVERDILDRGLSTGDGAGAQMAKPTEPEAKHEDGSIYASVFAGEFI